MAYRDWKLNGRTYESIYGTYNKDKGFIFTNYARDLSCEELINNLLHENCWSLKQESYSNDTNAESFESDVGFNLSGWAISIYTIS